MSNPYEYVYDKVNKRCVAKHIFILLKAGNIKPPGFVTHHLNFQKRDNRIENLCFLKNSEHLIIHHNKRALLESGSETQRKCGYCHQYDDIQNLRSKTIGTYEHPKCRREYNKLWMRNKRKGGDAICPITPSR